MEREATSPGRTIAAIATGSGGGVGIVRVSGPRAESIGRRLCRPLPETLESHRLYFGAVFDPDGAAPMDSHESPQPREPIDQVLFCLMRAPRSYTGEDVLELQGHGGAVNLRRLLDACLRAGAVAAEPGEFTRRAFLAGKLDLTAAEAVAQLVLAQSEAAARQAQRQLGGELGRRVAGLRKSVVDLLASVEGSLDFPDLEEDAAIEARARTVLEGLGRELAVLSGSFRRGGKALGGGLELALIGRTNAGKSSLINALCGSERVLVDAQPGTTRDVVEVATVWEGVPVLLIDTAGERPDATALERAGRRIGRERARRADLALLVVDGTAGLGAEEEALRAELPPDLPHLVLWNKIDQSGCQTVPQGAVACSALCGWGLPEIRRRVLADLAPQLGAAQELLVTSARQASLLEQAGAALASAAGGLLGGALFRADLLAGELRVAASRLGELTGADVSPDVLDGIFAQFCVGK